MTSALSIEVIIGFRFFLLSALRSATSVEMVEKAGSLDSPAIREAVLTNEFKGTVMEDVKYDK
jgi:hypothetical protein